MVSLNDYELVPILNEESGCFSDFTYCDICDIDDFCGNIDSSECLNNHFGMNQIFIKKESESNDKES